MEEDRNKEEANFSITSIIVRVLLTALVVGITAFFTPGFVIQNLWSLLVAAIIISGLDYSIEKFAGIDASPFGRGLTGFIVAVAILYLTKLIVPGFNMTMIGAFIGSLAIGIIDVIIPGKVL